MRILIAAVMISSLVACGETPESIVLDSAQPPLDLHQLDETSMADAGSEVGGEVLEVVDLADQDTTNVELEVQEETVDVDVGEITPVVSVQILLPEDGAIVNANEPVHFQGLVADEEDEPSQLQVEWLSDLDNTLHEEIPDEDGLTEFETDELSTGVHTITLRVVNSKGLAQVANITVTVNTPPVTPAVAISPATPGTMDDLEAVLTGEATDADGDDVAMEIDWFKDGEPVEELADQTFAGHELTAKGETWSVVVKTHDGLVFGEVSQDKVVIVNTPPTLGSATVEPAEGHVTTVFTCLVEGWEDPDGTEATYDIAWQVNGETLPGETGDTLGPAQFVKGDLVACAATPEDDEGPGETVVSAGVNILNSLPVGGEAELTPVEGTVATTYECVAEGTADPDGDGIVYAYSWMVNGEEFLGVDSSSIDGSFLGKGDTLVCRVVPSDGEESGLAFESNPATVINSPPAISGATVGPPDATGGSTLLCEPVDETDADGDELTYQTEWAVNGETLDGENELSLKPDHFVKWDLVTCTLAPFDGDSYGGPATSDPLEIGNALPTLESVQLTPGDGNELTLFFCTAQGWFDADNELFEATYQWLVNGEIVEDTTEGFLSGLDYDKGDEIVCNATPKNGDDWGEPVVSNTVIVANAPPHVGSAKVDPPAGPVTTMFTCTAEGLGDPDPVDEVTATYQWMVDGEPLEGATEETVDGYTAGKGASLSCQVTPLDQDGPGAPMESEPVMVVNTAPSLLSVSVQPEEGNMNTEFQCVPFGWMDPDGDLPDYLFRWFVDGDEVVGLTDDVLVGVILIPGMQISCEATPIDGDGTGFPLESPISTVVNHPPTVEAVELGPVPANTDSVLTCKPTGFFDEDGDPENYLFQWVVDGQLVEGATENTLSGENFDSGQEVECWVTAYDGYAQGPSIESNTVSVGNSLPTIDSVAIDPPQGSALTEFQCEPSGWTDVDEDPEDYVFAWFVDDAELEGETGKAIASPAFKKGDALTCRATPFDGKNEGSALDSEPVVVGNAAPSAESAEVKPEAPVTTETLACEVTGWSDADDDQPQYEYAWTVNDQIVAGQTGPELTGDNFEKHQQVVCIATPTDGEDKGQPAASPPVTVANTLPVLDTVSADPAQGGRLDEFTCNPGQTSDLDADAVTLKYLWLVDGQAAPGGDTEKYTPSGALPGAKLACRVTPCDDDGCGEPVTSEPADVINKLPAVGSVKVEPAAPFTDQKLTCLPDGWQDDDNDPEQYQYAWLVDGETTAGQVGEDLATEHFSKHQQVVCRATPDDGYGLGQAVDSPPVTVLNSAPALDKAYIDPGQGTKSTSFTCVAGQTTDADSDDVNLGYAWLADGQVVDGQATDVYEPMDQAANVAIACRIIPDDGEIEGQPVTSNAVVLGNTAPTVDSVELTPAAPYTDTLLTCNPAGIADKEEDPVEVAYAWFVEGLKLQGQTGNTLAGDQFVKHQNIHCAVTPNDGIEDGQAVLSNNVKVLNTPPTAPVVSVVPGSPGADQDLTCQIDAGSTDKDNDQISYTYQWYLDDALQAGLSLAELSQDETKECQTWRCEATPSDGNDDGASAQAEETVDAGDEVCDNHDNNCNGDVDEGFDVLLLPCDGLKQVTRRIPITIEASTDWELNDFQVKVQVGYQPHMQPDFVDLRFTTEDGKTLLPFWRESFQSSTSAVFWVKVPKVPAKPGTATIYLYYGNPLAASRSNIHTTFLFADDFQDPTWTTANWTTVLGTWSASGGVFQGNGDDAAVKSAATIPAESRVMEGKMKTVSTGPDPWDMAWMHIKYKDESNDVYGSIYHAGSGYSYGDVGVTVEYNAGFTVYDTKAQATPPINPGAWNDVRLEVNGINAKMWVNGQPYIDANNGNIANLVASNIGLAAHDCVAQFDDIRVRQYAPAQPAATLGSVQEICVPVCEE